MEDYRPEEVLGIENLEPLEPLEPQPSFREGAVRFIVDILETILLSVLLFLGINALTARVRVDGHSMVPTFDSGEFIIVSKLSYRIDEPTRGDIVVFHLPRDPDQDYIKRIIGLPGETVEIKDGRIFVNSYELDEPYINAPAAYSGIWLVEDGSYFVLGDNRNNSSDSHSWGSVPLEFIVGRAVFVYWPIPSVGVIDHLSVALASP